MTKPRYRVRREAMEWRRNKVEGLLIKGYTQNRIAQELPKTCPKCRSPYWDTPRKKEK